jgi:hypothetical protein
MLSEWIIRNVHVIWLIIVITGARLHHFINLNLHRMKRIFYTTLFILSTACLSLESRAQANQSLSNLTSPTAVNTHLLPLKPNVYNLGTKGRNWHLLFVDRGIAIRDTLVIHAPGKSNFFAGMDAGNSSLTGLFNTGIGYFSLTSITSGERNTAVGHNSLVATTSGGQNTAVGYNTLAENITGIANIAIGENAMLHNTGGGGNTAVGNATLINADASDNTAIGDGALSNVTSGNFNTGCGDASVDHTTTGTYNVGIGGFALHINATGSFNTALGALSGVSDENLDHATAVGAQAIVNASNKMQLGSSTTVLATTGGITIVSDGRFKDDVNQEDVPGLAFINQLRPVTYTMNYKRFDDFLRKGQKKDNAKLKLATEDELYQKTLLAKSQNKEVGFIAQEVDKLRTEKNFVFNGVYTPQNDQDNYALDYSRFVVPLVKAVQELSKENDEYKEKIDDLQQQINELKALIHPSNGGSVALSDASLEQNTPNPFHGNTIIGYNLPQRYTSAQIIVRDNGGKLLKEITINGNGKGTVSVDASLLSAGTYNYSLVIDGKTVTTKQMLLGR